jgi:hypothetical protein
MTIRTDSEKKAFTWLIKTGYQPQDLRYQGRTSPDFIGRDGRGFEVKLVNGRTIMFADTQIEKLSNQETYILVFSHKSPLPQAVLQFQKLNIPGYSGNYRLIIVHYPTSSIDKYWQVIPEQIEIGRKRRMKRVN